MSDKESKPQINYDYSSEIDTGHKYSSKNGLDKGKEGDFLFLSQDFKWNKGTKNFVNVFVIFVKKYVLFKSNFLRVLIHNPLTNPL